VEDGFEIGSESGVILVCKVGDGTALPAGTALLVELSGVGDEIASMVEFPPEFLLNLPEARHCPSSPIFYTRPIMTRRCSCSKNLAILITPPAGA
jgi:hypothetical protein